MRKVLLCVTLLTGCTYLANGSPSAEKFWVKENNIIDHQDRYRCHEIAKNRLKENLSLADWERFTFLENEFNKDPVDMILNKPNLVKEYNRFSNSLSEFQSKCYYGLGYRFTAPWYWCIYPDKGNYNSNSCTRNNKYR